MISLHFPTEINRFSVRFKHTFIHYESGIQSETECDSSHTIEALHGISVPAVVAESRKIVE